MQDIECVFESMSGRGSIFISNLPAAQNVPLLHSKGIRAILSVTRSGLLHHKKEQIPHYLYIPAEDHEDYHLRQHFDQTYQFIEKARKETNILVHCIAGVSRSVTIVIAYLLKKYKYTLEQIMSMIHRKRRKINPNRGFIEQLKKFAESQGVKCDMRGDYLQVLRGHSASRGKKVENSLGKWIENSREKIRKVCTSQYKSNEMKVGPSSPIISPQKLFKTETKPLQQLKPTQQILTSHQSLSIPQTNAKQAISKAIDIAQTQKQRIQIAPTSNLLMRKLPTFDQNKHKNLENVQSQTELKLPCRPPEQMKKSMSVSEKSSNHKRGLSIEEKIKRVRDRVLKNDQVGMQGFMRNNVHYSPIYKKSRQDALSPSRYHNSKPVQKQQKLESTPLKQQANNTVTNTTHTSSLFKSFREPSHLPHTKPHIQSQLKAEQFDKQLFSDDIKLETPSLYSPIRMHKRASSKLQYQNGS